MWVIPHDNCVHPLVKPDLTRLCMSVTQGAGTSAHVLLELFGGEGATPGHGSGVHCLEQGPYQPTPFGPGQTDAFEVSAFWPIGSLIHLAYAHAPIHVANVSTSMLYI